MTEQPLTLGSLWFLIGVAFEGVSREHPDADGKTLLSLALAQTIRSHLAASDEEVLRWLLAEIAEALDNPDAVLRLTLKAAKKGPLVSPISRLEQRSEAYGLAEFVWREWKQSGQMEAAIAAAQSAYSLSRSTVFSRLKAAAIQNLEYRRQRMMSEEQLREMDADPSAFVQIVPLDDESDNFEIWLDRYLDESPADEG